MHKRNSLAFSSTCIGTGPFESSNDPVAKLFALSSGRKRSICCHTHATEISRPNALWESSYEPETSPVWSILGLRVVAEYRFSAPASISRIMDAANARKRPASRGTAAYPRKRAVTACQTCRARRTKCDNLKPKCSFCLKTVRVPPEACTTLNEPELYLTTHRCLHVIVLDGLTDAVF